MDYIFSILIGVGLSAILLMAPILTGIFGRLPYLPYVALAIYVPFFEFDVPKWPYIFISMLSAYQVFKINDSYARTSAMSIAPEWAARCQTSYFFIVAISYIVSLFI
jgi:hypothetical protein